MEKKAKIWVIGLFLLVLTLAVNSCTSASSLIVPSKSKITPSNSNLQGYITDLKINGISFQIGNPIVINGNFHAQADGNYYIEVGLPESSFKPLTQALTVLKASQSACDQNVHYAGVWANNIKNGDVVPFELTLKNYGKTGTYDVVGGVYSKCGVGSDIASIEPITITITSSQPEISSPAPAANTNNNPPAPSAPVTQCTPSGYFTQLQIRTLGNSDSSDNSKTRVVGTFHNAAPCAVTYYIESGMLQSTYKPLSVVQGIPSACDGNVHFSGVKVSIPANSNQDFALYPANYGADGRYILQGGVYYNNGQFCGNADIASFQSQEIAFGGFSTSVIDNSWIAVEKVI